MLFLACALGLHCRPQLIIKSFNCHGFAEHAHSSTARLPRREYYRLCKSNGYRTIRPVRGPARRRHRIPDLGPACMNGKQSQDAAPQWGSRQNHPLPGLLRAGTALLRPDNVLVLSEGNRFFASTGIFGGTCLKYQESGKTGHHVHGQREACDMREDRHFAGSGHLIQRKIKYCSLSYLTVCPDPAAVPANYSVHRGKTDARTTEFIR